MVVSHPTRRLASGNPSRMGSRAICGLPTVCQALAYPSKQLRSELKQVDSRPPGGSFMESSRSGCVGRGSLAALSIIRLPALQHCDQDGRQAVNLAKASIVKLAERIVLNAAARPMIYAELAAHSRSGQHGTQRAHPRRSADLVPSCRASPDA